MIPMGEIVVLFPRPRPVAACAGTAESGRDAQAARAIRAHLESLIRDADDLGLRQTEAILAIAIAVVTVESRER
jgi:hypothetical protein